MIDQDRLETARAVLVALLRNTDNASFVNDLKFRKAIVDAADDASSLLHEQLKFDDEPTGHPAEIALEQLIQLLADHDDKRLPKWIAANARHRKLTELSQYLGADIETA